MGEGTQNLYRRCWIKIKEGLHEMESLFLTIARRTGDETHCTQKFGIFWGTLLVFVVKLEAREVFFGCCAAHSLCHGPLQCLGEQEWHPGPPVRLYVHPSTSCTCYPK